MLKRLYLVENTMQLTLDMLTYTIIIVGMILQTIWLYIGRNGRNSYMSDITHFRKPSSYLSKLYAWRLKDMYNPLIEGLLFEVFLIITVLIIGMFSTDFESLYAASSIIVLVGLLSFLSAIQMARRVRTLEKIEMSIIQRLKITDDKIGSTRELVKNLYDQGQMGDGRKWFALFKLAQRDDISGYAIRDVLLEKGKEMVKRSFYGTVIHEDETSEKGPGIT
jgi:hypothetical protein